MFDDEELLKAYFDSEDLECFHYILNLVRQGKNICEII